MDVRKKEKRYGWALRTLLLSILLLCCLSGCGAKERSTATTLEQLREPGRIIGVGTGTGDDAAVREAFPEAEIRYLDDSFMGYSSVANGKLDAMVYGKLQMELAIRNGVEGVRLLDETIGESHRVAVGISPVSTIPDLETKLNAFIDASKADGTLDDMYDRWAVRGDETMPEIAVPERAPWHLRVATTGTTPPYTYYAGSELRGYDIELARRFAAYLGAELEFKIYDYNGSIAAAQSGDADCIMAEVFVTPERAEVLPFSHPVLLQERGVAVRDTGAAAETSEAGEVRWQDYNGKRLGVLVGPLMEDVAAEFFPDSEIFLFSSSLDCTAALMAGRIDAFLGDEPGMIAMHAENPAIDYIHETLTENNYAFAFRKDDPASAALCEELNEFLAACWADGTMDELAEIWLGEDETRKAVDMSGLTGENGTIRVVTTSTDMPWSYIKDAKNVGYDIDLVVRFCRAGGYQLELGDVDYAGLIPAVQSGKYDFSTDMNVTAERREQVFTAPLREKTRRFIQKRRVLELDIHSRSYDFPGAQSEIGRYCERNQIPRRMTRHIQLAFEELVQQLLLPAMAAPDIGVTLEYAQDTEQTEMLLRYGGAALDVTAEPDALPLLVLKSAVDDLRYDHIPDTERGNRLRARILP